MDRYSDLVLQMADYADMVSKQRSHMADATRRLIHTVLGHAQSQIPSPFLENPFPWSQPDDSTGANLSVEQVGTEPGARQDVRPGEAGRLDNGNANGTRDGEQTHKKIGLSGCWGPGLDSNGCYLSVWTGVDLSEGHSRGASGEEGGQCGAERGHKASVQVDGELIGPWAAQGAHTFRMPPVLVHPGFRAGSWFEWLELYASRSRLHGASAEVKVQGYSTIRDEWRGSFSPSLSESNDSGGEVHGGSTGTFLQILYPRDGAVYSEGYVPVSYRVEGPVPDSFRIGVYVDGDALDIRSTRTGRFQTPFATPFRTFNVWFDAGPHELVLELVDWDDAHLESDGNENLPPVLAVGAVSIDVVCFFCMVCCDAPADEDADADAAALRHVSSVQSAHSACAGTVFGSGIAGVDTPTILIVIVVFNQVEMLSYQAFLILRLCT